MEQTLEQSQNERKEYCYRWHIAFQARENKQIFIQELLDKKRVRKREYNRMTKMNQTNKGNFYIKMSPYSVLGFKVMIHVEYGLIKKYSHVKYIFTFDYQ